MRHIRVLDTTLRDGEQSPGAKLNREEKLEIARQLVRLGVDYVEAGFPSSSPGDFAAVEAVAREVGEGAAVTALARALPKDIDAVYHSIKGAPRPMIHIVLGSSSIHIEKKFKKSKEEVLRQGVEAVAYAKRLLPEVQYSTEDASRSDFEYLWNTIREVVNAGATIINVPDTVGYAVPEEFGNLIYRINDRLKNLNPDVLLSVHCHNDLGLATANTLMAVKSGADKVECTINGVGERAGNAALEEVIMGLMLRQDYYEGTTRVETREIMKSSRLVSALMGLDVQPNKAITGENAFAHSSGIHQDGLLKSRDAYEIISPEDVGAGSMEMVLTARSGRHAVKNALASLGFEDQDEEGFETLFSKFLALADAKKEVSLQELYSLAESIREGKSAEYGEAGISGRIYELVDYHVISNGNLPSSGVRIRRGNEILTGSSVGDGPIDALYGAIRSATEMETELLEFKIQSISRGKEAPGKVSLRMKHRGESFAARASDTDIIRASALAYINGLNRMVLEDYRSDEPSMHEEFPKGEG